MVVRGLLGRRLCLSIVFVDLLARPGLALLGDVAIIAADAAAIGHICQVGVDLDRAGTISWVSSSYAPAPWKDQNIINNWDQVSEVGCPIPYGKFAKFAFSSSTVC